MERLKKLFVKRLEGNVESFTDGNFKYLVIDDLLSEDVAITIARAFPEEEKLRQSDVPRRCVSNYYFSRIPTVSYAYNHVTSFYKFPEEKTWKGVALAVDRNLRTYFSSVYKRITKHKNWHKRL